MKKILLIPFCIFLLTIGCRKDHNVNFFSTWKLESYLINNDSVVVNYTEPLTLNINEDSTFSLTNPAGTCSGLLTKSGTDLNFVSDTCTPNCCPSYLAIITLELITDSVVEYEINNKRIKLKGEFGTSLLLSPK